MVPGGSSPLSPHPRSRARGPPPLPFPRLQSGAVTSFRPGPGAGPRGAGGPAAAGLGPLGAPAFLRPRRLSRGSACPEWFRSTCSQIGPQRSFAPLPCGPEGARHEAEASRTLGEKEELTFEVRAELVTAGCVCAFGELLTERPAVVSGPGPVERVPRPTRGGRGAAASCPGFVCPPASCLPSDGDFWIHFTGLM